MSYMQSLTGVWLKFQEKWYLTILCMNINMRETEKVI